MRDRHHGYGLFGAYRVIQHVMNLESVFTREITQEVPALILGRGQTGAEDVQ